MNREHYLIILPKESFDRRLDLEKIFRLCWNRAIVNVLVLQENGHNGTVNVYTFYPFAEGKCRNISPRIHNRYANGSFERNTPLFIPKVKNLHGCPVTLILFCRPDFVQPNQPHLFDQNILKILAKEMNFTLRYKLSPYGKGELFSPTNMTNMFKMLHDGLGDFVVNLFCSKRYQEVFEGVPYTFSKQIVVFKSPELYSSLEIFLFPFDTLTWILLSLFHTLALIFRPVWNRISRKLGLSSKHFERYVLGIWILSMFVLQSSYEGSLFKFLHDRPMKPLPKSFIEAVHQGYKFVVSNKKLFATMDEIKDNSDQIIEGGFTRMFKVFKESNGKVAWIVSKNYFYSCKIDGLGLVKAKKGLLSRLVCIYTKKHSFLASEISHKFLHNISPFGLQNHILSINKTLKQHKTDTPKSLSLQHLTGVFQLYFTLIGVSVIIFIIEHNCQ
ncbi:uncharacterized protein LOC129950716 [Eupeodes corollae]|uniref:uncharacterized protein LOC129950716 n=1 Tax=Eupeodes corollae TaxID=290404 RepID=UPI00248FAB5D|nr:uncharacterized protein LOC129950716 [Eupeodes corollae]